MLLFYLHSAMFVNTEIEKKVPEKRGFFGVFQAVGSGCVELT